FITNLINFLDRQEIITGTILRKRNKDTQKDFYDYIVKLMFEVILSVASVKSPSDKCWSIHYCTVWEGFFGLMLNNSKACKIIHYKLRRLLYDEICRLKKSPNYKSSKILGFCLNVMGLVIYGKRGHNESYYPLHKATITWVKNNYLHLVDVHPEVARACLLGSISFDEQGERLVKTYLRGL